MKETTKLLLAAIGNIAYEIRALRKDTETQNSNINEYIKLLTENNIALNRFKEAMDIRLKALQIAWDRQLANALDNQEHMIERVIQQNLILPLLKKDKEINKQKSSKKKVKIAKKPIKSYNKK